MSMEDRGQGDGENTSRQAVASPWEGDVGHGDEDGDDVGLDHFAMGTMGNLANSAFFSTRGGGCCGGVCTKPFGVRSSEFGFRLTDDSHGL